MELHQLRYFVTAVRLGTMSAAARELYVSQPSVSQQIRALERELGARLMLRLGRRLALTEAGEQFLAEAERCLAAADAGRERVRQVLARQAAPVRLGAVPSVDSTLLPKALGQFMDEYPQFGAVVLGPTSREVEAMLLNGELDIALTHFPPAAPGLRSRILMREELVLVGPRHHWSLRQTSAIQLSQLRDQAFVSSTRGSELHERLLRLCAEAGFTPRIALEARYGALREMVLAGHGLAILPRVVVDEGLPWVPIASKLAVRELYVISKPRAKLGLPTAALLGVLERLA